MIYGIGSDICDVRRMAASLQRRGERLAHKLLTRRELALWQQLRQGREAAGVRYLAMRFSAKEAFAKAIGLGMVWPMHWRACEIDKLPGGQPVIVLHGAMKDWFAARSLQAHLSLSDEKDFAVSFCVVESRT